ncbi:RNA polymerase sigma factor [Steroidobacter sp.]|uniref:RNA polymerase sigma factor n=1 Tax=Steroidobacter sp. TaxID=1978227 RepID=UPI001A4AE681|nr:sigma-70 family RNA polymerase sigma factor [Steroidobacter sp.]MBL8265437.1 sigma-70 family RNA polymerase sigma factor [Steroidobacter sp.]
MSDSLDTWFKDEVLVHEEALTRYLRRAWPHPDDIHDLRQEVYARAYESAAKYIPTGTRTFVFAIARHLLVDRLRKQRVVVIDSVPDTEALNVIPEDAGPEQRASAYEELRQLARALDDLPRKCREVVWMRRVEDLPQKEVAARLGLSEKSVEKHVMKGMKRLTEAVFGARPADKTQDAALDAGRGHGKQ